MFNNKRKRVDLASIVFRAPNAQPPPDSPEPVFPEQKRISKPFIALLSIIFFGAVGAYFFVSGAGKEGKALSAAEAVREKKKNAPPLQQQNENISSRDSLLTEIKRAEITQPDTSNADPNYSAYTNSVTATEEQVNDNTPGVASEPSNTPAYNPSYNSNTRKGANEPATVKTQYKVPAKAYFYRHPNHQSRKATFISNWEKSYAPLNALDEKNGFIYVVFTDDRGKTSEGWLRKKDVKRVKSIVYQGDLK